MKSTYRNTCANESKKVMRISLADKIREWKQVNRENLDPNGQTPIMCRRVILGNAKVSKQKKRHKKGLRVLQTSNEYRKAGPKKPLYKVSSTKKQVQKDKRTPELGSAKLPKEKKRHEQGLICLQKEILYEKSVPKKPLCKVISSEKKGQKDKRAPESIERPLPKKPSTNTQNSIANKFIKEASHLPDSNYCFSSFYFFLH